MRLDDSAAREAIVRKVGEPLGLSVRDAAAAMFNVINVNMTAGIREVSVDRGVDPRDFLLVVVGGAGPIHAGVIASELGIPEILVPRDSAVFAAAGMLLADVRHDALRALPGRLSDVDGDTVAAIADELVAEVLLRMRDDGFASSDVDLMAACDVRYEGQFHEIVVEVPVGELQAGDISAAIAGFDSEHERLYGWATPGSEMELVNLRVSGRARRQKPQRARVPGAGDDVKPPPPQTFREAYLPFDRAFREIAVYDGDSLPAGVSLGGPAIIELTTTTAFIPETYDVRVTHHGDFLLAARV
jgi:N-methylhydantoinase A